MGKLKFEVAAVTDAGIREGKNEDAYLCRVVDVGDCQAGIFVVADGVGGLQKGDVASLTAVSNVGVWWDTVFKAHYGDADYVRQSLLEAFRLTNEDLIQFGLKNNIKLATTMSALLFYQNSYIVVHTGDSRIYRYEGGFFAKLTQLTQDHSRTIQKEADGRIYYKQALTDCLGNKDSFQKTVVDGALEEGDVFLVCSDGVYKTMNKKTIKNIIKKHKKNPAGLVRFLVEQAKENGETDNISVIAVRVDRQKGE